MPISNTHNHTLIADKKRKLHFWGGILFGIAVAALCLYFGNDFGVPMGALIPLSIMGAFGGWYVWMEPDKEAKEQNC